MKNKHLAGAIIFVLTFALYLQTLCPTVAPRDSGELITAAATLGIAHPPGYPLYVMLGKLFTFIPFGSMAWRVNLLSAFFAAVTIALVYYIILILTQSLLASIIAPLFLALTPIFWSMATVAEVFQLNAFFVALTLLLLLVWRQSHKFAFLLLFAFCFGLSLSHHHSMLLLAPGYLFFIWSQEKKLYLKPQKLAWLGLSLLAGLLPYAFLPWRSRQNPYLDWGDPETIGRFFATITRAQYGSLELDNGLSTSGLSLSLLLAQFKTFFLWIVNQFTIFGLALGLIGSWASLKQNKSLFFLLLWLFLSSGLGFIILSRYPLDLPTTFAFCQANLSKFMLPAFLFFTLWFGLGLAKLTQYLKGPTQKAGLWLAMIALLFFSFTIHYSTCNKNNYYYAADLAENILTSLPADAIIFTGTDTTAFTLWYFQGVEYKRKDVKIISTTQHQWRAYQMLKAWPELLRLPNNADATIEKKIAAYPSGQAFLEDIVTTNFGQVPIYIDIDQCPELAKFSSYLDPAGILYKIGPETSPQTKLKHLSSSEALWQKYSFRSKLIGADLDYQTSEILGLYAEARNFAGIILALNQRFPAAKQEFQKALAIAPNSGPAQQNLARLNRLWPN
ncbi:hypothetical protein COT42_02400 [Candidatus Saganbacteria bacterium CG08_land_8_20_14_0_20_45_16]|uniref:Uncharacterized protein n=1 Tax=Candidatus Saganbacteria bacterium CG08_land_8_20_14_0_20_45_16 TaxID=2014293 RepID=A0A2H0Y089_UNCSA|nr:MAG: hypothetical protein COT42_02400 [Candidatus Saganbacteria bacterium CG08_land_8_20_14_0_20_45_16]